MSESEESILPGKLGPDQIDALRLETSNMSPKEHAEFVRLVNTCNDAIVSTYPDFIPEKHPTEELERKFLMMDKETFEGFFDEWYNPQIAIRYTEEGHKGYMREYPESEGGFVAGYLPQDQIWEVQTGDNKKRLIEQFGSEEAVLAVLKDRSSKYIVLHEIAHIYQNHDLPLQFLEAGAYYYARTVMQKKQLGTFSTENYDKPADFYSSLVEKYGADVHSVFFGQMRNGNRKMDILNEFTPEVTSRIFPDFKVTQALTK